MNQNGTTFPDQVTLHPETIQKIANEAVESVTILVKDKLTTPRPPKPGVIEKHIRVEKWLWDWACEMAGGDGSRVQGIGPAEVIIHNRPWRKK